MASEWLRLDNQLCFAVYSTSHAFTRVYKPLLDALGLTYPQYLVMMILWEQDGQTVGAVGERLFLDSSTLTPLLKRLESAGLLTRRRSAEDQRQVRLFLTDAGQALQTKAEGVPPCIRAATGFDLPELASLKAEILRLRAALAAAVPD